MPKKELVDFEKVCTPAAQTITFVVADSAVSVWDVASEAFVVVRGTYGVSVGASSADIRLTGLMAV